ncbi:hypothetical protein ACP4OV_001906 [Aristida adscensionis]
MPVSSSSSPEPEPKLSASAIVGETVSGSHVLAIEGYSGTKSRLGNGKFIASDAFTIAGHRWSIAFYPNGHLPEKADYIGIFLALERPAKDNVVAEIRFSLLDQAGEPSYTLNRRGMLRAFNWKAPSWGYEEFVPRSVLEGPTYLRNDCVRVRLDLMVSKKFRTEDRDTAALFIAPVPPPDVGRHLGHLLSGGEGADIVFEVDGETFPAHRYILATRSPVFMAELFGSMKEGTSACVRIDDMEVRVFRALLHFIYTDWVPEIDEADMVAVAQHLLVAADMYGLERLKLICESKLGGCIDTNTVATTLALAEQHGCHGLKQACFQFLMSRSNLKAAMETDGFDHLTSSCPSVLKELLAKVAL